MTNDTAVLNFMSRNSIAIHYAVPTQTGAQGLANHTQ